jgi:hypothetical protein
MDRFDETEIVDTVNCLPIKENKISFSVSLCNKQTEVCRFHFPLVSKETDFTIFFFSAIRFRNSGNIETWKHGYIEIET